MTWRVSLGIRFLFSVAGMARGLGVVLCDSGGKWCYNGLNIV